MAGSRRRPFRIGIGLGAVALALGGLTLGLCGLRMSRADVNAEPDDDLAQQVTVFAIIATPGTKTVDSNLLTIRPQLDRLMPRHGFKLLDSQSKRIVKGESVTCDLGNGYTAQTELVQAMDDHGKVQLRCELSLDGARQFSTLVKTPLNQLFFCRRKLRDGAELLLGVGVR